MAMSQRDYNDWVRNVQKTMRQAIDEYNREQQNKWEEFERALERAKRDLERQDKENRRNNPSGPGNRQHVPPPHHR